MYQNLINSLKKILDSKSTQAEKLLKISTLVDFAEGLDNTSQIIPPAPMPTIPPNTWYETVATTAKTEQEPNKQSSLIDAKKPNGVGPLIGIEDVK